MALIPPNNYPLDKLVEKIKSNQRIYDQMRATELFEEMESKVEAYRLRNQ